MSKTGSFAKLSRTQRRSRARALASATLLAALCAFPIAVRAQGPVAGRKFTVLHSFTGHGDGRNATGGVIADQSGNLYGTTFYGGHGKCAPTCGVVFQLVPPAAPGGSWTENIIYKFNPKHGYNPAGPLMMDANGVLYGTTELGGDLTSECGGCGVVYQLKPPATPGGKWRQKVLWEFEYGTGGNNPSGGVIMGPGGVLYGTTSEGGNFPGNCVYIGCGVVFALTPPATAGAPWTETVLYAFSDTDGNDPMDGLAMDAQGALYGATYYGGTNGGGVIFQLTPPSSPGGAWAESALHNFLSVVGDGNNPYCAPVLGPDGVVYGTTERGGANYGGTVFQLTPPAVPGGSWTENALYSFDNDAGGQQTGVVLRKDGVLYGLTTGGGTNGSGTLFRLAPPAAPGDAWQERILHSFAKTSIEGYHQDGLLLYNDTLYGTTFLGGNGPCHERHLVEGCGIVFEFQP